MRIWNWCIVAVLGAGFPAFAQDEASAREAIERNFWISVETGAVWQTVNRVQIPADSGTRFALTDFGSSGGFAGRVYLGYRWKERHEIRALYAPLAITVNGSSAQPISFQGQTFASQTPLEGFYRFNSYRLTYRYVFHESEDWTLKVGFTAKVRDAEIRITQGESRASRANVGFVPLLHFAATYRLSPRWFLLADLDALAAPQGRAEDLALQAGYRVRPEFAIIAGYRTVEGGASGTGGVYNFAWLHYAVLGAEWAL